MKATELYDCYMYRCNFIHDLAEYLKGEVESPGYINHVIALEKDDKVIVTDTLILSEISKQEFKDMSKSGPLSKEQLDNFLKRGDSLNEDIKQKIIEMPEKESNLKEIKLTDLCIGDARIYKVEDELCAVSTKFNFMLYYQNEIKTEGPNCELHVLDHKGELVGIVMPLQNPLADGATIEKELKDKLKEIGIIEGDLE